MSNLLEMVGCDLDELGMNFPGPRLVSIETMPPGLGALVGCPPREHRERIPTPQGCWALCPVRPTSARQGQGPVHAMSQDRHRNPGRTPGKATPIWALPALLQAVPTGTSDLREMLADSERPASDGEGPSSSRQLVRLRQASGAGECVLLAVPTGTKTGWTPVHRVRFTSTHSKHLPGPNRQQAPFRGQDRRDPSTRPATSPRAIHNAHSSERTLDGRGTRRRTWHEPENRLSPD